MKRVAISLLLVLFLMSTTGFDLTSRNLNLQKKVEAKHTVNGKKLSPMKALDMIRKQYAADYVKILCDNKKDYYYKDPEFNFYLVYEGMEDKKTKYLIHQYEFVVDEEDTGLGHTYTYGWYLVDKKTGVISKTTY